MLDTDVLSALLKGRPSAELVRRLAAVPPERQYTTAVNAGGLAYGALR